MGFSSSRQADHDDTQFLGVKGGNTGRHGHTMRHIRAFELFFEVSRTDECAQVSLHGGKDEYIFNEDLTLERVTHVSLVTDNIVRVAHEGKSY